MKKQCLLIIAVFTVLISMTPIISDNSEKTAQNAASEAQYEVNRNNLGETAAWHLRK